MFFEKMLNLFFWIYDSGTKEPQLFYKSPLIWLELHTQSIGNSKIAIDLSEFNNIMYKRHVSDGEEFRIKRRIEKYYKKHEVEVLWM